MTFAEVLDSKSNSKKSQIFFFLETLLSTIF